MSYETVARGSNWELYVDVPAYDNLYKTAVYVKKQFIRIRKGDINYDDCKSLKRVRIRGLEGPTFEVYELRTWNEEEQLCGYLLVRRETRIGLFFEQPDMMR